MFWELKFNLVDGYFVSNHIAVIKVTLCGDLMVLNREK